MAGEADVARANTALFPGAESIRLLEQKTQNHYGQPEVQKHPGIDHDKLIRHRGGMLGGAMHGAPLLRPTSPSGSGTGGIKFEHLR